MEGEKDETRSDKKNPDEPSSKKDIDESTIIDLDIVGFEDEAEKEKGPLEGLRGEISSKGSGILNLTTELKGKADEILKRRVSDEGQEVPESMLEADTSPAEESEVGDEDLEGLKAELEVGEAEVQELLALKDELEAKIDEVEGLKDDLKEMDNEMLKLKGAEMRQNIKVKALEQNLAEKESTLTETHDNIKVDQERSTAMETKISKLGGRVGDVSQGLMGVKSSHERHSSRLSLMEKEVQMVLGDLQKLIPNMKGQLETFAITLDKKEAELQDLFHENETLMASNIMVKQQVETLRKQNTLLEKDEREATSGRSGLEFTAQRQEVTIKNLERELEDKLKIIADMESLDQNQDFQIHEMRRALQKIRLLDKVFADNLRLQKE